MPARPSRRRPPTSTAGRCTHERAADRRLRLPLRRQHLRLRRRRAGHRCDRARARRRRRQEHDVHLLGRHPAGDRSDIRDQQLDGLVVASCSPKLHTDTFREVARRAGLNPYEYTQVNIREQCSWTHTDDRDGATRKAISLVRAGIARTRLTEPLEPTTVQTTPRALVIGGGVAGMRAAIGLADLGLAVFLVERADAARRTGGRARQAVPARHQRPRARRAPAQADPGAPRDRRSSPRPR